MDCGQVETVCPIINTKFSLAVEAEGWEKIE